MKEAEHSAIPLKTRYRQELIEELQRKRDSPEEENKQDATHQRQVFWINLYLGQIWLYEVIHNCDSPIIFILQVMDFKI